MQKKYILLGSSSQSLFWKQHAPYYSEAGAKIGNLLISLSQAAITGSKMKTGPCDVTRVRTPFSSQVVTRYLFASSAQILLYSVCSMQNACTYKNSRRSSLRAHKAPLLKILRNSPFCTLAFITTLMSQLHSQLASGMCVRYLLIERAIAICSPAIQILSRYLSLGPCLLLLK